MDGWMDRWQGGIPRFCIVFGVATRATPSTGSRDVHRSIAESVSEHQIRLQQPQSRCTSSPNHTCSPLLRVQTICILLSLPSPSLPLLFFRRPRPKLQRVDPAHPLQLVLQQRVDHPMPRRLRLGCERLRGDH